MEFISQTQFLLYFFYYLFSIFIAFYIPGTVLLHNIKITVFQKIVLGTIVGLSFWALQGFIFGFLHVRALTYVYLTVFLLIWIYQSGIIIRKWKRPKLSFRFSRSTYIFFFTIFAGMFVQISSVFFTGLPRNGNLYFCCGDAADFLYFLSLSKNLVISVPPMEPGFENITVQNYHYLSNLVVADLHRVFAIPLSLLEFQFSFVFLSLFLGLVIVTFSQLLKRNNYFTFWLLFFFYFGGDAIWLLMLLLGRGSHFFSMGGMEDGSKFLMNLPRSFAIDIILSIFSLFILWDKHKSKRLLLVIGIISGTLIGFKVYVGIFMLCGLIAVSVYYFFFKQLQAFIMFLISLGISLILYLPVNSGAGGFYFTGLWSFENFIVQPYLQLGHLELARVIYAEHHNWLHVIFNESLYIFITIFASFGTKLFGLVQTKHSLKQFPLTLHLLLLPGLCISFILGFFFQQTSGGANTFNFVVNILLLGNIYVALALSAVFYNQKRMIFSISIAIIVILLTVPRVVDATKTNLQDIQAGKGFTIYSAEIQAYKALNTYPKGLVLVDSHNIPFDNATPYIGLFTTQDLFSSGLNIAESHAVVSVEKRKKVMQNIFQSKKTTVVAREMENNNITYILTEPRKKVFVATPAAQFVIPLYLNKKIEILEFSKNRATPFLINK